MNYTRRTAAVRAGDLSVGEWVHDEDAGRQDGLPVVVGVHGITSQHLTWAHTATHARGLRIVAPDLRGRAGSRELPGPWGLSVHADDITAMMDSMSVDRAVGAGHSMGAFALLLAADRRPDLFDGLLLIDGGLPLAARLEISEPEHLARIARETVEGFERMRFQSIEEHRQFWLAHPARTIPWDEQLQAYVDNELVWTNGAYQWSCDLRALDQDTRELFGTVRFRAALQRVAASMPVTIVSAQRGLFDDDPPVYRERQLEAARQEHPGVRFVTSATNHYMTVLGHESGRRIADELRLLLKRRVAESEPRGASAG